MANDNHRARTLGGAALLAGIAGSYFFGQTPSVRAGTAPLPSGQPEPAASLAASTEAPLGAGVHVEAAQVLSAMTRHWAENAAPTTEAESSDHEEPTSSVLEATEMVRESLRDRAIADFPIGQYPQVVDSMLQEQSANPAWTEEVVGALYRLPYLGNDDTTRLAEAQCYGTLCKVVTSHASEEDSRAFWSDASDDPALAGPGLRFTTPTEDGGVQSINYFGRRGEDQRTTGAIFNRVYELVTSSKYDDIAVSPAQVRQAMNDLEHDE